METTTHADGRVELREPEQLRDSPLYNEDLAPVAVAKRTWSTWDYAALWISMAHCIPTYQMASSMIENGMSWWQALGTIALGNIIVLAPILLNSHPGTKYGIPFPVFARAAYGTVGSNLPALMRALIACGWFGINAWIGGHALQTFLTSLWPGWAELLGWFGGFPWNDWPEAQWFPATQWISFALFWGLNILIIYRGMELVRRLERFAAPFVLVMTALLLAWAIYAADGLGPIMAESGLPAGEFFAKFIPALTATIGFWSTLSLNMPDFTRYGRSQREQVVGQVVALPSTMTVFAAMGIIITSATVIIFKVDKPISDPIALGGMLGSRAVIGVAMFTIVVATLAVNIAANVVSPANDFANAFPGKINFARGGLITGVIGILMMPWELLANADRYINGWLVGYSGALGSVAGVLIVDYWVLRKTELDLRSLYVADGAYRYERGWNMAAVYATLAGAGVALLGAFWSPMRPIYDWSWFVGFGLAGGVYWLLMRGRVHPR
ncbi:MAG: NCS1 family nucleobase:cation symporter-1 [Deltaproteobacteria bacterium]|nr:NCS1 family nucleobase:cation symporter-1 [Deltaproteobacteria bacterium]MCW5801504.1 NCS1 family nucleobase:cation symporter-1 [Deltaproteobacteria bacterium]